MKLVSVHGGKGETKEADHSSLVGDRFSEQRDLYKRLVWGDWL